MAAWGCVLLYALLDGDDLRCDPRGVRKATLASLLARPEPELRFNEHLDQEDGPVVFQHACKLGLEGIVSKRREFQEPGFSVVCREVPSQLLAGQHGKVVGSFARDPTLLRLASQIAIHSYEPFEAAFEQATVRGVNDGHE
jgi:hypothetical protein